jgi:hypothetical protein
MRVDKKPADMIRPRLWDFCGMTLAFGKFFRNFFVANARAVRFLRMEGQGETVARSLAPFLDLYSPGLVGSNLQPCERRAVRASALAQGIGVPP